MNSNPYGHVHQGSIHSHHLHSNSSAHHNHHHSVSSIHHDGLDYSSKDHDDIYKTLSADATTQVEYSPDHLYVRENVFGEVRTDPSHSREVLTGTAIVFPWIAFSWYQRQYSQNIFDEVSPDTTATSSVGHIGQKTCFLTAITLILFGCGQVLRTNYQKGGSSGLPTIKFPMLNARSIQASLSQIVSVALPLFAAFKVGGFLVAFTMLLATASGIPAITNGTSRTQEKYSRKPMSIALLLVVIVASYLGLNRAWDVSPVIGYTALLSSVFVLPPPFPSLRRNGPIPEPGLVALSSKTSDSSDASIVVTTDAPLAVIAGSSLALLTILFNRGFVFSSLELISLLFLAGLFAISLMISFPTSLRSPNKKGLAISAGAAALLCSPHVRDDLLMLYAARGILATVTFFASRSDDAHLHIDTHAHNHTHNHSHSHSHTSESSRISKWLLHKSEPYPLLHSILKEKDSRSIFYFMW